MSSGARRRLVVRRRRMRVPPVGAGSRGGWHEERASSIRAAARPGFQTLPALLPPAPSRPPPHHPHPHELILLSIFHFFRYFSALPSQYIGALKCSYCFSHFFRICSSITSSSVISFSSFPSFSYFPFSGVQEVHGTVPCTLSKQQGMCQDLMRKHQRIRG